MRKGIWLGLLSLFLAAFATAQTGTFFAVMNGAAENPPADPDGAGFGIVTIDAAAGTATFALIGFNIATPIASHIHRGQPGVNGPIVVPFNLPFTSGTSAGSTTLTNALANEILGNPTNFYMNIHTGDFPGGAIRGQMQAAPTTAPNAPLFEPVVAKVSGANGENFLSDVRLLNRSASSVTATLDFFASNSAGLAAPTATRTVSVPPGSQLVLNDVLGNTFSASGIGALRISATGDVIAVSRLLNDKRSSNAGTTGGFVSAARVDSCKGGTLFLLSQASAGDTASGVGFRTGIGYFNPNAAPVTATFTAKKADGTSLGSKTVTIPGFSHAQFSVFALIDTVASSDQTQDDFSVTYTVTGGPLLVYASVVDNRTGDGSVEQATCTQ